jgi:hypothetical protein
MLFIFPTLVVIRCLWQLKTVVFLHWCIIRALLFTYGFCHSKNPENLFGLNVPSLSVGVIHHNKLIRTAIANSSHYSSWIFDSKLDCFVTRAQIVCYAETSRVENYGQKFSRSRPNVTKLFTSVIYECL